jgi:soluble lytic murein transglycosylase
MKLVRTAFLCLALLAGAMPVFGEDMRFPASFMQGMELFRNGMWKEALELFQTVNAEDSGILKTNIAYLEGYSLIKLNRPDEAVNSLRTAAESGLVGDWALYNMARIASDNENSGEAIRLADRFLKNFPYSPIRERMIRLKAENLLFSGKPAEAAVLLKKNPIKDPDEKPLSLFILATALEKTGRAKDAYLAYQEIYYGFPDLPLAEEARKETVRMQKRYRGGFQVGGFKQQMRRIKFLMKKGKYAEAESYINSVIRTRITAVERSRLWLKKAIALKMQGKRKQAVIVFRNIINQRPKQPLRPRAIYMLAKLHWNRGENRRAFRLLSDLIREYPADSRAGPAYYIKGRIAASRENFQQALEYYKTSAEKYPKARTAENALWEIGWLRYNLGDYSQAEKIFRRHIEKYRFSEQRPKFLFWLVRTMEKEGKNTNSFTEKLRENFPFSYYALFINGIPGDIAQVKEYSAPADSRIFASFMTEIEEYSLPFRDSPKLNEKQKWYLDSAKNWILTGFGRRAEKLLALLENELPDSTGNLVFMGYQHHRSGDYSRIIKNFWKVRSKKFEDGKTARLVKLLMFPLPHWKTIRKEAEKNRLDPRLLLAIMRQESAFNPDSVSRANAHGLMQIIPKTAEKISRKLGMKKAGSANLLDPHTNIRMGAFHLASLLKESRGKVVPAVASYNAGRKAVKVWLERFPDDGLMEFIEKIPFSETRTYVKNVLRNYGIYKEMYKYKIPSQLSPVK